jgi:hypothetical protein
MAGKFKLQFFFFKDNFPEVIKNVPHLYRNKECSIPLNTPEKDRQCTCSITKWHFCITIVEVDMQQHILCFFFPHHLINNTITRKKLLKIDLVF